MVVQEVTTGGQSEGGQTQVSPTHDPPATGLLRDDPDRASTARAAKFRLRNILGRRDVEYYKMAFKTYRYRKKIRTTDEGMKTVVIEKEK